MALSDDADPLILTLALDAASFARFDAERREHFPARLNRIPAHVTLFHHLPGSEEAAVLGTLGRVCAGQGPAPVRVIGLVPLGRGVAYRIEAPEVAALREELVRSWGTWLGPQDRQGWRPHVTVQNKVAPEVARDTLARLRAGFAPWEGRAEGLLLWRYRGGPWDAVAAIPFAAA